MNKITEIIPENMPDWAREAMMEGQLFNKLLGKIESQANEIEELTTSFNAMNDAACELQDIVDSQAVEIKQLKKDNDILNQRVGRTGNEIADLIEEVQQLKNPWVSCDERLPEDCLNVFCTNGRRIWQDECLSDDLGPCWFISQDATRWMPIPEYLD